MKIAPIAPLLLAGCVAAADAPSLAPRPIETRGDAVASRPEIAVSPIDPALAARIATLLADASAGDADFSRLAPSAQRAIAGGRDATEGTERWIEAERARSELQVAQQVATSALAELDALLVAQTEAAARDPALGGLTELAAAKAEVELIVDRQRASAQSAVQTPEGL